MREVSFEWMGQAVRLVPSMQLLSRIAFEVRRVTDGAETTVSLAYKCINGGMEPLFMLIPLRAFLQEALGDKVPTDEEIWHRVSVTPTEALSFRMAYAEAVLPHVNLGKDRAALSTAQVAATKTSRRKSTSKAST